MISRTLKAHVNYRAHDEVKEEIRVAKENFKSAISNLELNDEANKSFDRSYLDCAIHITLNMLELVLIERMLSGKDQEIEKSDAADIGRGKWETFLKPPTSVQLIEEARNSGHSDEFGEPREPNEFIVKFLGKIRELRRLQTSSQEVTNKLRSQKFVNEKRQGLLVTTY